MSTDPPAAQPPLLQVVKGDPTDEELAAVLLVLQAPAPSVRESSDGSAPGGWSAYWRTVRAPLAPGPGAWRASGRSN